MSLKFVLAPSAIFLALLSVAQDQPTATPSRPEAFPTIKSETREVLVDAVVVDKKGNPLRDLTAKDFKVFEDNKEQAISSFSFEQAGGGPEHSKPQYMVLFFDNSSMDFAGQAKARDAAAKFLDANAGPNRLIAIAEYGGQVHITQNFTADGALLKKVAAGFRTSHVTLNQDPIQVASLGGPSPLDGLQQGFAIQSVATALRDLAKGLASVPGRKSVVMLTEGFPLTPEAKAQLTAVIDSCNKANVAVYPIDVRGLVAPDVNMNAGPHSRLHGAPALKPHVPQVIPATFTYTGKQTARLVFVGQHGGGGGGGHGGGGGTGGGGGHVGGGGPAGGGGHGPTGGVPGGGSRGGGPGAYPGAYPTNSGAPIFTQPRAIVPDFPANATDNQQPLYELAEGTGGFVILNTNDLLGGMEKIARDQAQYYLLGYHPGTTPEGSCHSLRVKVETKGAAVRSRSGYCNVKPLDLLAGDPVEKTLETRASAELPGNVNATLEAPYFYTAPNTARVNLAMDVPATALKFDKVKGKQHATINVLGIAYNPDGAPVARFSDTVNFDFEDKKQVEEFQKKPVHYENQFEIASGRYNLRVVFSSGNESFGKIETPLVIQGYGPKQFGLSALALCDQVTPSKELSTGLDSELLENKTPLIARGMQFTPSSSNRFKVTDNATIYVEMYAPALIAPNPPKVTLALKITDLKTGKAKVDAGIDNATSYMQTGALMIPIGLKLPVSELGAGSYRVQLKAMDSAGQSTLSRSADFEVE